MRSSDLNTDTIPYARQQHNALDVLPNAGGGSADVEDSENDNASSDAPEQDCVRRAGIKSSGNEKV